MLTCINPDDVMDRKVRVSCDHMVKPPTSTGNGLDLADDLTLLANMRDAAGVLYNVSHNEKCFVIPVRFRFQVYVLWGYILI